MATQSITLYKRQSLESPKTFFELEPTLRQAFTLMKALRYPWVYEKGLMSISCDLVVDDNNSSQWGIFPTFVSFHQESTSLIVSEEFGVITRKGVETVGQMGEYLRGRKIRSVLLFIREGMIPLFLSNQCDSNDKVQNEHLLKNVNTFIKNAGTLKSKCDVVVQCGDTRALIIHYHSNGTTSEYKDTKSPSKVEPSNETTDIFGRFNPEEVKQIDLIYPVKN